MSAEHYIPLAVFTAAQLSFVLKAKTTQQTVLFLPLQIVVPPVTCL